MVKLIFTGDLVITDPSYGIDRIDTRVVDHFKKSDYNIINLESPITLETRGILKTGPHLKGAKKPTLEIMKLLNINMVTLANNHILDYGHKGFLDTIEFAQQNNLAFTGVGDNLDKSKEPSIIDIKGIKIGIVNVAENEWANATNESAGATPLNTGENVRQIRYLKDLCDYVVMIIHGGIEYYNLPSPRMKEQYTFFAEMGADLIVGHHTHCINGHEIHQGTPIFYSLGNFLFTKKSVSKDWYIGHFLEVTINSNGLSCELRAVVQDEYNHSLSLATGNQKKEIDQRVVSYVDIIKDKNSLQKKWDELVKNKSREYISNWSPLAYIKNPYIIAALRRLKLVPFNKKGASLLLNLSRCEAHSDISHAVITKYLKEKE